MMILARDHWASRILGMEGMTSSLRLEKLRRLLNPFYLELRFGWGRRYSWMGEGVGRGQ